MYEVYNAVRDTSAQRGSALLVLYAIAQRSNVDYEYAEASVSWLARDVRMSERRVQQIFEELVKAGELIIETNAGYRGRSRYYVPLYPDELGFNPQPCTDKGHRCNGTHTPLPFSRVAEERKEKLRRMKAFRGETAIAPLAKKGPRSARGETAIAPQGETAIAPQGETAIAPLNPSTTLEPTQVTTPPFFQDAPEPEPVEPADPTKSRAYLAQVMGGALGSWYTLRSQTRAPDIWRQWRECPSVGLAGFRIFEQLFIWDGTAKHSAKWAAYQAWLLARSGTVRPVAV